MNEKNKQISSRGIHNWKKALKFNKSDWFWSIFFILLFFSAYGYWKDIQICGEIIKNPCDYCNAWMVSKDYRGEIDIIKRNKTEKQEAIDSLKDNIENSRLNQTNVSIS